MTSSELNEKLKVRTEEGRVLQELWKTLFPDTVPHAGQFQVWLDLHPFERMVYAIKTTGAKNAKLAGTMTLEHAVRYCSKTANIRRTKEEGPAVAA